ncbi:MAG: TetR/AcrR family transcriptional regulator [Gimesia chilikensis]|uniref:TetR/AcrR family transcriptional regulator n=1 Tax=Gimesia chilikensis TaxID=2605989 RepID=UPI0037B7F98F
MKKRYASKKRQAHDGDSANTRQRLLEVGGQIFAEKGFDRTTSKEITEQAGTNSAAVNYYFEGIEGLYAAVLEEASNMLIKSADMEAAVAEQQDAKAKLKTFLSMFINVLTSPASSSWRLRVLIREFASPTFVDHTPHEKSRLEKMNLLKGIVSELMDLPEDHPSVGRGCISIMGPCFMLMICDRVTLKHAFPQLGLKSDDASPLVEHMMQFALAGLAAVIDQEKQ